MAGVWAAVPLARLGGAAFWRSRRLAAALTGSAEKTGAVTGSVGALARELGPAAVFFSDMSGFTAMSETMEPQIFRHHPPPSGWDGVFRAAVPAGAAA